MKDIPSSALYPIFLGEPGRYGNFMQHAGTPPVSDVQEGVYIISNTPGFYFERIVEHRLNVLWFGAVGDDTVQCSPALNGAVAISKFLGRIIYTPSGTYRTNACVPIDTGVTIEGDGCQPYKLYPGGTTPSTRGNGTWFHITHTTAPLFDIIRPSGGRCSGVSFKNFGMFQDHPTIAAGWVPTTYPFCIRATAVDDVLCEDLMFHGCYAGIQMTGSLGATGAAGRLRCHRIKGQCFSVGIDIDFSADVSVLDDIHLWPFWSDNNDVRKWTRTNGTAIRSARNDNPKFSNIFAFSYRYGLLFTGNASGVTSRFLANNIGFDDCPRGFYVNSAGAATTGSLTDGYVAAKPAAYADEPGADLFVVEGINTELRLTNLRLSNSQTNSVYINASGCFVYFANGKFDGWNLSLAGHAAISVAAGSTARLYNNLNTAGNGGGSSGGSGSVTYV
jgi:hypothetical protein